MDSSSPQRCAQAISEEMFDFTELSRRTLANNWKKLSPEQRKEFVVLYTSLLQDAYSKKIMAYSDEKITFTKEVALSEKTVEVQSTVLKKSAETPIYYRVTLQDGAWRVYDVVVDGISLISNYRSLTAHEGPSHTKDHQFGIEAIPLEENMTFIHLRYSSGYSALGYFLMKIFGGGKVGFSEIGAASEGNPVYVEGLRGSVERDVACFYLAILAFLDTLKMPCRATI